MQISNNRRSNNKLFAKTVVAALALMFSGLAFADSVQFIENGGFEDAGLFPWVGGGETLAVVSGLGGEVDPRSGEWMALLSAGGEFSADLTQTFGPGDLSGFTEFVISFSLNIAGFDFSRDDDGTDMFTVALGNWHESMDIDLPFDRAFVSGWIDISFTVSIDDVLGGEEALTLQFFLDNCMPGECSQFTSVFLDNISVVAQVPEPGTLALFGIGLLGLAFGRRRKASS